MKINVEEVTIGSDPEFFLTDLDNNPVSSIGLIGGTKLVPKQMDKEGYFMQEDNVAVEYNIPPVKTADEFNNALQHGINYIFNNVLDKEKLKPCFNASKVFPFELLNNPTAREFGCTPSNNAWTYTQNLPPNAEENFRSIGFHIHVGFSITDVDIIAQCVRAMDLFLGVPSVVLDPDTERRKLYGKAGEFRFTKYGFEYRVLSGFFNSSEELRKYAFNQTLKALEYVNNNSIESDSELGLMIQECINTQDINLTYRLIEENKIELCQQRMFI